MRVRQSKSGEVDVGLLLKIGAAILAAGMWLGALQMQVSQLKADHEYHFGKEKN